MAASTFREQRRTARRQQQPLPPATEHEVDLTLEEEPARPEVPDRLRTVAYFVLLVVSAVIGLTAGLAPIWLDEATATRVVASAVVVSSAVGTLAGGLGVVYRPTAQHRRT